LALWALAGCVSASPPGGAGASDDAWYSPSYTSCLKTAHGVRPIEHCTAGEIAFQRGALDRLHAAGLAARSGARRDAFVADERAWNDEVEARCAVFSRRRGSLNSMKAQDCFLHAAVARRRDLGDSPPRR
jgi:uncharacterized protein YecT (DUF1311 family)